MSAPSSPMHSRESRHSPPPSPPASPPGSAGLPFSRPTFQPIASTPVNTPPSPQVAVHELPTPPKDEPGSDSELSEAPDAKWHNIQDGVIDLREGTDYSR
ncbi:hypothetical protein IAT38_004102 [Cryptococcus sp. DSM 104549]